MKGGLVVKTAKKAVNLISKNSPIILTTLSVAGLVTTVAMGIQATPLALELLEERGIDKNHLGDAKKRLIVKTVFPAYIPTLIMGSVTIICIVGANAVNARRHAALMSLYSISEKTLKDYQAKVIETVGAGKEQKIRDDLAKDRLLENPTNGKQVFLGTGEMLCFDALSGRYFRSDMETMRRVQNDLNQALIGDMNVSLNEVYYALDLPGIKIGDDMGWTIDHMIDFTFSAQLADNGQPCIVLDYKEGPRPDYRCY